MNLWPKIETIKALFIYGTAAFIVVKVLQMLSDMVQAGAVDGAAALGLMGAFGAGVISFLFGVEQGKQQQKAFEAGLAQPQPLSVTTPETETRA